MPIFASNTQNGCSSCDDHGSSQDQNNIVRVLYYLVDMNDDVYDIADKINSGEPFTVGDIDNIIFLCLAFESYFSSKTEKYILTGMGKGTYGAGGTQITTENLEIFYRDVFAANSDPRTQTVSFTLTGSQTISQWLNVRNPAINIQPQSDGYTIFKGTINGVVTSYLWVGDAGVYGNGQLQSTMVSFQLLDQDAPSVIPTMDNTNRAGNTIVDQSTTWTGFSSLVVSALGWVFKQFGYNINIVAAPAPAGSHPAEVTYTIPAKTANDTFAMISDVAVARAASVKGFDLPNDFFIVCAPNDPNNIYTDTRGSYLIYKTDINRALYIRSYIPEQALGIILQDTAGIDVQGNDIFIKTVTRKNIPGAVNGAERGLLKLGECRIIDNVLVPTYTQYKNFTELHYHDNGTQYNLHGMYYSKGYMFLISRRSDWGTNTVTNTQVFKVNCADLSDTKVITFDKTVAGFEGYASDIIVYENYAYFIIGTYNSTNINYISRVDLDLKTPEMVLNIPTVSTDRLKGGAPFEIYNGEMYIATVYNLGTNTDLLYNAMGIRVYDLAKKALARSVSQVKISTQSQMQAYPHWLTVVNGKILLHTSTFTNTQGYMVRFDAKTLAFEESILLQNSIYTNVFTVSKDGWVYANPEGAGYQQMIRYRYDNFTLNETLQMPIGYVTYSNGGSPRNYTPKNKLRGNLSEFVNDIGAGTPPPATSSTAGIVKLYTATGTNNDGPVDQNTYTTGMAAKANDADVVHKTGNETIAGTKTFANISVNSMTPNIDNGFSWGSASLRPAQVWGVRGKFNVWQPSASGSNMDIQDFSNNIWGRINATTGNLNWGGTTDDAVNKLQVTGGIKLSGMLNLGQFTSGTEPAYVKGATYFNTTINKARIGGATAWETITSS